MNVCPGNVLLSYKLGNNTHHSSILQDQTASKAGLFLSSKIPTIDTSGICPSPTGDSITHSLQHVALTKPVTRQRWSISVYVITCAVCTCVLERFIRLSASVNNARMRVLTCSLCVFGSGVCIYDYKAIHIHSYRNRSEQR